MKNHRFHELDAMRAIAALGVVCWHYVSAFHAAPFGHVLAPFFKRGLLMVDFFFVLSGFVLARAYWTDARSKNFIANTWSRVARLYPLHVSTLLIVALLQWWLVHGLKSEAFVYPDNDAYHFLLNLVLLQNSGLQHGASFNAPSWSISTEFLANVTFLLLITLPRRVAAAAMSALGAIAIYGMISHGIVQGGAVFGLLDGGIVRTFAGFFLGVGLYRLNTLVRCGPGVAFDVIVLACTMGIGFYLALPQISSTTGDVLCSFAGFPLLILSVIRSKFLKGFLSKPIPVYLGEISYSIYLVHFPIQLMLHLYEVSTGTHIDFGSRWIFAGFMLAVASAAGLTYRWIELPGRILLNKLLPTRKEASESVTC